MITLFEMFDIEVDKSATLQDRFNAFHSANPKVYLELRRLGRILVAKGHKKIGIQMLFEQMRWQWIPKLPSVSPASGRHL